MNKLPTVLEDRLLDFLAGDSTFPANLARSCKRWRGNCARYKAGWFKTRVIIKIEATSKQSNVPGFRKIEDEAYIIASQEAQNVKLESPLVKDWGDHEKNFTFSLNFEASGNSFRCDTEIMGFIDEDEHVGIFDLFAHYFADDDDSSLRINFSAYRSGNLAIEFEEYDCDGNSQPCTIKRFIDVC